jgi:hypothetical protein
MAAIVFPSPANIGDLYPDPGVSGVTQYRYDGVKWDAVLSTVSLGSPNQSAFNDYQWPLADGAADQQLTTDGSGNLTWGVPAAPSFQLLQLDRPFTGTLGDVAFTLETNPGGVPFTPDPVTNLVVFLGGVPQVPSAAYSVSGNTITFTEAPLPGTTFYAISNVIA